jgi:hypothetical protein
MVDKDLIETLQLDRALTGAASRREDVRVRGSAHPPVRPSSCLSSVISSVVLSFAAVYGARVLMTLASRRSQLHTSP